MIQGHDRYEKVVAMTVFTSNIDGAAIFNPLVDAPPEPPHLPASSYQHTTPYHHHHVATASSPSGTMPIPPNYYYSSSLHVEPPCSIQQQQHSHSMTAPTSSFYDDLEWQQPEQRHDGRKKHYQSCRLLVFMGFLIFLLSCKRHWQYYHDEHRTTLPLLNQLSNNNDRLDQPHTDDLVDASRLVQGDGGTAANTQQEVVVNDDSTLSTKVPLAL